MLRSLILFLAIPLIYLGINPDWYGDALWYASEVESQGPIIPEAFHLLWIPLARMLANLFVPHGSTLFILQLMSGVGAALTLLGTHQCSRYFYPEREVRWVVAFVACSHFLVAYGGSGASYSMALGAAMMAYASLLNSNSRWREAGGVLWMVLALSAWGVAVLGMVAFLVASYVGDSSRKEFHRIARSIAVSMMPCVLFGSMLVIAFTYFVPREADSSFLTWVLAARGHGVATGISLDAFAKAALGFASCAVYLDGLGTSLKQVLRGELSNSALYELVPYLFTFLWWTALVFLSLVRMRPTKEQIPLVVVSIASIAPVGFFALGWHGSDVERWCLSLPFIMILVWSGVRSLKGTIGTCAHWAILLTLIAVNVVCLAIGTCLNGGSLDRRVAESIRHTVPEGSLVIVTGQTLGARGGHIAVYFSKLRFHSVSFDVLMRGEEKWKDRLTELIDASVRARLPVVVLSDMLGESTPGGIGLSPTEFPRPTMDETRAVLKNLLVEQQRIKVDSFQFVVMRARTELPQ